MNIKVLEVRHVKDYLIEVKFNDGCVKLFDFAKLISFDSEMTKPLREINYFKNVFIVANGGGISWANEYDCCVDWLRYFALDESGEWKGYDENFSIEERIKITQTKHTV